MVLQPALWRVDSTMSLNSGEPIPLSVNPNGLLRSSMVAKGAVVLVDDNGIQTHLPFVLYTESRMSNIPILEWISTPSNGISVAIFLMAISSYKSQNRLMEITQNPRANQIYNKKLISSIQIPSRIRWWS